MQNKTILYVGGFELPDKNAAAHRVISNSRLLNQMGYEIVFFGVTKNNNSFNEYDFESFTLGNKKNYTYTQQYPKNGFQWLSFLTSIKRIKKIINNLPSKNIDIIIAYDYPAIKLWKLKNYCKRNNIKLVADTTEWYEAKGNLIFKLIKSLDTHARMSFLHKRIDGIIVISRFLYDYYRQYNTILIPPLIDKSDRKWDKVNCINSNECKLIYVGSPGAGQKDRLDLIISSLDRIKDKVRPFSFTIIGLKKEQLINSFTTVDINLLKRLEENIIFKGKLPHLEAIKHIKYSDYTIFVRDKNRVNTAGFPTKFVESLACGTPVLTNLTSNINQFLVEGELGYIIDDFSLEAFDASLIKALNKNKNQILRMKEACFNYWGFDYRQFELDFLGFMSKL